MKTKYQRVSTKFSHRPFISHVSKKALFHFYKNMDYIYPKEKKKLLNNYMQNKLCLRPRHNINKQDKENQKWLLYVQFVTN